jgi:nanoRNase/pAp phosphatase (c-di-AMP/oligoRNAs hydrolase)
MPRFSCRSVDMPVVDVAQREGGGGHEEMGWGDGRGPGLAAGG